MNQYFRIIGKLQQDVNINFVLCKVILNVIVSTILGIVRSMYMMNLDEDVSSDEKMNTTDDANLDVSKGDGSTIDFTYRGGHIR